MGYYIYYEVYNEVGLDFKIILKRFTSLEEGLIFLLKMKIRPGSRSPLYLAEANEMADKNLQVLLSESPKYYLKHTKRSFNRYSLQCTDSAMIPEDRDLSKFFEELGRYNNLCRHSRTGIYELYRKHGLNEKYKYSKYFTKKSRLIYRIVQLKGL